MDYATTTTPQSQFLEKLCQAYFLAKKKVIQEGYAREIDWQDQCSLNNLTETQFLREAAWVVLSSGMKEKIISAKFPEISKVFFDWKSSGQIAEHSEFCFFNAVKVFGHHGKIKAIIKIAKKVHQDGFSSIKCRLNNEGLKFLNTLPFIGPVTQFHLGKNIGMDVVKPDRHLVRIADALGYNSPLKLCEDIATFSAEKISVIDLVLWRYATLDNKYLEKARRLGSIKQ